MYITHLEQASIQDLLREDKGNTFSPVLVEREKKSQRLIMGKEKLSEIPKNPSHFCRIKNGAHGITSTLLRTCSNMPFLPQKLPVCNYLGLIILLLLSAFQSRPRQKNAKSLVQKEGTIESNVFTGSEVETETNMLTHSLA